MDTRKQERAQGTVLCVPVVCTLLWSIMHTLYRNLHTPYPKCTQRRPFVKMFKHFIEKRLCGSWLAATTEPFNLFSEVSALPM